MKYSPPNSSEGFDARILFFLISLLTSLLLFIIDEGRYSLSGLNSPDNVIALIIYGLSFFAGQYLIFRGIKALSGQTSRLISVLGGVPLGFVFALTGISIITLMLN